MATQEGIKEELGGEAWDTDQIAAEMQIGKTLNSFSRSLYEIGKVADYKKEFGQIQWDNGCEGFYEGSVYLHLLTNAAGQEIDESSGLLHAAHAAWSALMNLETKLRAAEKQEIEKEKEEVTPVFGQYITENKDVLNFT